MNSPAFLVTGVAGDIGFGIGRIIKESYPESLALGCDVDEHNAAEVLFDHFLKAPYAKTSEYVPFIIECVKEFSINIVVPTSEAEIDYFWKSGLVQQLDRIGVKTLILDAQIVEVSLDKYKTAMFLKDNSFNYPCSYLASQIESLGIDNYPYIFKPRIGQGSKNVIKVHSLKEIDLTKRTDDYVVQEYLPGENQEYTCCVFGNESEYRAIAFRRTLKNGFTFSGEVVEDYVIHRYIISIAKQLNLVGSLNLQLRMVERGPVLFEINPRFSSTVVFRHKLGFCDFVWAVEELCGEKISEYQKPYEGLKFYRGITEYFVGEK